MMYRKKQENVNASQFWPIPNKPLPEGVVGLDADGMVVGPNEQPVDYSLQTRAGEFIPLKKGDVIATYPDGVKLVIDKDLFYKTHEELDLAPVDTNKLFRMLDKVAFSVTLNMNDTFGWACADAEDVAIEDLPKLMEVYEKFGTSGVDAFAALQRDEEVMDHKAVRTPLYYAAKDYLKDYEFHGDEYTMRKYWEAHPEELAKKKAEIAEREAEEKRKRGTKWARIKAILFEK